MTSSEHFREEFIVPLTKIAVGSHFEVLGYLVSLKRKAAVYCVKFYRIEEI